MHYSKKLDVRKIFKEGTLQHIACILFDICHDISSCFQLHNQRDTKISNLDLSIRKNIHI